MNCNTTHYRANSSSVPGDPTSWTIDTTSTYDVGGSPVTFDGFETLQGGTGNDTFDIDVSNTIDFFGGAGDDTFTLEDAVVVGSIDGQADSNTLDYSPGSASNLVTLTSSTATGFAGTDDLGNLFAEVDVIQADDSSGFDRLQGRNVASTWVVHDTSTYSDGTATLTFMGFEDIFGGNAIDDFTVSPIVGVDLLIDGGDPTFPGPGDTLLLDLVPPPLAATPTGGVLTFSAPGEGTYNSNEYGDVLFQNIESFSSNAAIPNIVINATTNFEDFQVIHNTAGMTDNLEVYNITSGAPVLFLALPFVGTDSLTFNGNMGGNNLVVVDTSGTGGDPIPGMALPTHGIFFNGNTGDSDVLRFDGTGVESVTYTPTTADDGTVTEATFGTVTVANLDAVDLTELADVTFSPAGANDLLAVDAGNTAGIGTTPLFPAQAALIVSGTTGGLSIADAHVRSVGLLTIDTTTSDGADTVNLNSGTNAHLVTNFAVNTGINAADLVDVKGMLTFTGTAEIDSQAIDFDLAGRLTAPTVDLDANTGAITTDGSAFSIDVAATTLNAVADDGIDLDTNVATGGPGITATVTGIGNISLDEFDMAAVATLNAGTANMALTAGTINLRSGTFILNTGGENLANASAVTVGGTTATPATIATLDLNAESETIGALADTPGITGGGIVQLDTAGQALTTGAAIDSTFSGQLTGAGNLVKTGATMFTLSNNNILGSGMESNYSGTTTINAGTLNITGRLTGASGAGTVFLAASNVSLTGSGSGRLQNRGVMINALDALTNPVNMTTVSGFAQITNTNAGGNGLTVDGTNATVTSNTFLNNNTVAANAPGAMTLAGTAGLLINQTGSVTTFTGNTFTSNAIGIKLLGTSNNLALAAQKLADLTFGAGNIINLASGITSVGLQVSGKFATIGNLTVGTTAFNSNGNTTGQFIELRDQYLVGPDILSAAQATFDGITGQSLTAAQQSALEMRLYHFPDESSVGLIILKEGVAFISNGNLVVVGKTPTNDSITVTGTNPANVKVYINGNVTNPDPMSGGIFNLSGGGRIIVFGLSGNDTIQIGGSIRSEVHGGAGNDVIYGGTADDIIYGDGGDDTISGGAGNDVLIGGLGKDNITGDAGRDVLIGGMTDPTLSYDVIFSNAGRQTWATSPMPSSIALLNALFSGMITDTDDAANKDTLSGSSGTDAYYGRRSTDSPTPFFPDVFSGFSTEDQQGTL